MDPDFTELRQDVADFPNGEISVPAKEVALLLHRLDEAASRPDRNKCLYCKPERTTREYDLG